MIDIFLTKKMLYYTNSWHFITIINIQKMTDNYSIMYGLVTIFFIIKYKIMTIIVCE